MLVGVYRFTSDSAELPHLTIQLGNERENWNNYGFQIRLEHHAA